MNEGGLNAHNSVPVPDNMRPTGHIFSDGSLIETENWRETLKDWWGAIKPRGSLILFTPDCRFHDSKVKVTREDIVSAFQLLNGWECLEDDMIDGHHFAVLAKVGNGQVYKPWRKSKKHCFVSRPGALGDALMASSIFPGLKEQGYDIDFYCHHNAVEAVMNDPHLARIISTTNQQVPDVDLPLFWQAWEQRYDRMVNLTNSVEGILLAQHWRSEFFWPEDQRRRVFKGSYLKATHDIAGVPGPYRVKFYETPEEASWADEKARELGPFILWCLRGSAVHKWYPHAKKAICQLLVKHPEVRIVLSADEGARPLENDILIAAHEYVGQEGRIHSLVGTGSVRRPMALAKRAKVVVGPETGVLNAVSLDDVAKVCLLSHSAPTNLTNDWVNAQAVLPDVPCYPCHRLHHGHGHCPQDQETTAAVCAASITPSAVTAAVSSFL